MPYENVTLGPAYAVRLHDLAAADSLVTTCMGCGRTWRVAPHRLHDKYRAHTTIKDIVYFFICRTCNGRDCTWHIERAYHPDDRINPASAGGEPPEAVDRQGACSRPER